MGRSFQITLALRIAATDVMACWHNIRHWRMLRLMIFIEAPPFERVRQDYLDDDGYRLLQATLMVNPAAGDVIRGSGGIRKIRWAMAGTGKRGGLRVIYYWITRREQVLLLTMYRKSEVSDLTPTETRALRALVEHLEDCT